MIKEIFQILYKWRIFIIGVCFCSVFFTGIIVKTCPQKYYSNVVFVLSDDLTSSPSMQAGSLSQMLMPFTFSGAANVKANLILNLLESDRMAKDVIKKFELLKFFKTKFSQHAIDQLRRRIKITYLQFKQKFEISIYMDHPQLSADIANFFVQNLNTLNTELRLTPVKEVVKVIDAAEPSEYPAGPYLRESIIIMFFLSLCIASFLSILFEYIFRKKIV